MTEPAPRATRGLTIAAALVCFGWLAAYAVTGQLSDDGLHALAARCVLQGQVPYADFQYHQAPLLPYLLAGWFAVTGVSMLQAKLFAALLGGLVLLATAALARRAGAAPAGVALAAVLASLSPSLALHLGYVQSQALATLLGLLACLTALRWPTVTGALLAGLLVGLAAGARLSVAILLIPLLLHLRPRGLASLAAAGLGAIAAAAAVLAPFAGLGLADALYVPLGLGGGAVTRAYEELYLATPGLGAAVGQRLAGWPNQLVYYAPIWLLLLGAWWTRATAGHRLLLGAAVALTIAHGLLPQRINHSYLVVAMPFWLAWLAGCGVAWPTGRARWAALALLVAAGAVATQRGLARIDRSGGRTVLAELREIGDVIARTVEPDEPLFTFSAEAAVAADRGVWPGCEPGYFSYFPNLQPEAAAAAHVLEPTAVRRLLGRRQPKWVLLHDGAFEPLESTSFAWPDGWRLVALLKDRYEPVEMWAKVGEQRTGLVLLRRLGPAR